MRFQNMIIKRKWVFIILGGLVVIPLLLLGAFYVLVIITFSLSDFQILYQDCIGVPIEIRGLIQDENHRPVSNTDVHIYRVGFDEPLIDHGLKSDEEGRFSAPNLSMFACDVLQFTILADGFASKMYSYTLFDDYTEAEISTTQPNLIDVKITLERPT